MGVLNFHSTFRPAPARTHIDVLSLGENFTNEHSDPVVVETTSRENVSRIKRKRTKSASKPQYNFHDYGIDERRRGSKHQRRKQNFDELQELVGSDDVCEEEFLLETQMTVFAQLLLDESKMKVWERFIALSEDKQGQYMEEFQMHKVSQKPNKWMENKDDCDVDSSDDTKYLLIDKKIRDVLRSKQLSNDVNGLLNYYEDDVNSCITDVSSPAILILDLEDAYDRMLVYAVCQYMKLSASTIKLKTSTIVEIELDEELANHRGMTLTEYLRANPSRSE